MVPISKVTLSVAVQHNKELEKQQAAIQQVTELPVYDGIHSTPHCVSFCSKCTLHSQLRPVHRPHAASCAVPLMSAATYHIINACGSLHVTVSVEPCLYAASPVAASPGSVQHQSGLSGNRRAVCKQPMPRQQKGCL